jgi:two-component system LytT family sensor kinase
VNRFIINTEFLNIPSFTKRPFIVFLIHWIVWILLYAFTYLPTFLNATRILWEGFFFTYIILSSINFLLFYFVAFYILPRIAIQERKWWLAILISICLIILWCYFKFRAERFRAEIVGHIFSSKSTANRPAMSLSFFSYSFRVYAQTNIFTSFSIVILAYAYRLLLALFMQQRISRDLENQKLKAELSFLKMQINPHFLFNALNNIYSLTVIEKSKKAGDSILKLSEMMRYVLYEKEDDEHKVSLDTEIKQLNNYIDLEKLRHASDLQLHFSIEGDTLGKRIAPLLLFPLLENAFKHGVLSDPEKPLLIHLKAGDKELHFSISNHINDYQKDQVGGIGIQNVHKRLELLYGNRYSFTVREEGNVFFADLKLPL